jgi:transformer-2 protein
MGKEKQEPVLEKNKSEKIRKNSDRSRSSSSDDDRKSRRSNYRSRSYSRSRSRSRQHRRHESRERPQKSRILGVFGLSQHTIQEDLFAAFRYYGELYFVIFVHYLNQTCHLQARFMI